jgi:hypothetical protein
MDCMYIWVFNKRDRGVSHIGYLFYLS